jgi:predicted transcriptional regulator
LVVSEHQPLTLIEWLAAEQRRRGLSDRAFARELGIPQQTWSLYKSKGTGFGMKFLSAVVRAFPGQREEIARSVVRSIELVESSNEQDDATVAEVA